MENPKDHHKQRYKPSIQLVSSPPFLNNEPHHTANRDVLNGNQNCPEIPKFGPKRSQVFSHRIVLFILILLYYLSQVSILHNKTMFVAPIANPIWKSQNIVPANRTIVKRVNSKQSSNIRSNTARQSQLVDRVNHQNRNHFEENIVHVLIFDKHLRNNEKFTWDWISQMKFKDGYPARGIAG